MHGSREDIERLSANSLSTALGVDVAPCHHTGDADLDLVWSRIAIDGPWSGELQLGCDPRLLERGVRRMFGDEQQITTVETGDVSLELANIIGGNLAPLLGNACRLSLPRPGQRPGTPDTVTTRFAADGAPIVLELTAHRRSGARE